MAVWWLRKFRRDSRC